MDRAVMIETLRKRDQPWDVVIIGGGATGLGCAVDAASRGYATALIEQSDFAKATSSRSTKLAHGGVRYLRRGNVSLVLESLRERGIMRRNAPHLVSDLEFVVPAYDWWQGPFYGIGLRLYDLLAGRYGFGRAHNITRDETIERIPTIARSGLRGGVVYYDGQFDDARLALELALTAADQGATVLNYCQATSLVHDGGTVCGVKVRDVETDETFDLSARSVINATGVFVDTIRRMDDPESSSMVRASRGTHVTLDPSFLPGKAAIMVPETDDGRVLFAIPWSGKVVVGTTDVATDDVSLEPYASDEEIHFILDHAARYLDRAPARADVLSAFAGLRPLVSTSHNGDTASISRDHEVVIAPSGLVTIAGGKWTTYRKMAQDAVDHAAAVAGLEERECKTDQLRLHGCTNQLDRTQAFARYGSQAYEVRRFIDSDPSYQRPAAAALDLTVGEVVWMIRQEMARTVDDVLSRRTRWMQLDARAAARAAAGVAAVMALFLHREREWEREQVDSFCTAAERHLPR